MIDQISAKQIRLEQELRELIEQQSLNTDLKISGQSDELMSLSSLKQRKIDQQYEMLKGTIADAEKKIYEDMNRKIKTEASIRDFVAERITELRDEFVHVICYSDKGAKRNFGLGSQIRQRVKTIDRVIILFDDHCQKRVGRIIERDAEAYGCQCEEYALSQCRIISLYRHSEGAVRGGIVADEPATGRRGRCIADSYEGQTR